MRARGDNTLPRQYDLTTDFTSQLNLPDGQRDTYFNSVLTVSIEPLRSLPRIS